MSCFVGIAGFRLMKTILVALMAVFALLVGFNNITDYGSNFAFVQHVLSMDTIFEGNQLMWRAVTAGWAHHLGYWIIIALELSVGLICAWGAWGMLRSLSDTQNFLSSCVIASWGLILGISLWFGGFMTVGAEWFLMWQSSSWNGQEAAFRFIMCLFATLIFLHQGMGLEKVETGASPSSEEK